MVNIVRVDVRVLRLRVGHRLVLGVDVGLCGGVCVCLRDVGVGVGVGVGVDVGL